MFFPMSSAKRRYPSGAEVIGENQTDFRVWAPKAQELDVVVERGPNSPRTFHSLTPGPGRYFSGVINAGVGTLYRFRVNGGEIFYPDPASRFQPAGPHASSYIIHPAHFPSTPPTSPDPPTPSITPPTTHS